MREEAWIEVVCEMMAKKKAKILLTQSGENGGTRFSGKWIEVIFLKQYIYWRQIMYENCGTTLPQTFAPQF